MTTVIALIMDTVTRPMGTVIPLMDFMAGAADIPSRVPVNIILKGGDMARGVIVGVAMEVECLSAAAISVAEYPAPGVDMEVEFPMGVGYPGAGVVMEAGYPMGAAYPGAGVSTEAATVDKAGEAVATFTAVEVPAVFLRWLQVAALPGFLWRIDALGQAWGNQAKRAPV